MKYTYIVLTLLALFIDYRLYVQAEFKVITSVFVIPVYFFRLRLLYWQLLISFHSHAY